MLHSCSARPPAGSRIHQRNRYNGGIRRLYPPALVSLPALTQEIRVVTPRPCRRTAFTLFAVCLAAIAPAGCRDEPAPSPSSTDTDASASSHPWSINDEFVQTMNLGVARMEQYEYQKAVEAFEKAVELEPGSLVARVNIAIALFNRNQGEDFDRAAGILQKVLEEDPDNHRALFFLGALLSYGGEDERALPHLKRLVELRSDDPYAWYFLGRVRDNLGEDAREDFLRAIELAPNMSTVYHKLHTIARRDGDVETAERHLARKLELDQCPVATIIVPPNYQRMGPLGLVEPLLLPPGQRVTSGELSGAPPETVWQAAEDSGLSTSDPLERHLPAIAHAPGLALADVNGDGFVDIVTTALARAGRPALTLLLQENGIFVDGTAGSGLESVAHPVSCAFGDFDNDGKVDLFVACDGPNYLFEGQGNGIFRDVTDATGTAGPDVLSVSAVFLDADHDADLDIYVCNASTRDRSAPAANQLLNNNMIIPEDRMVQDKQDCILPFTDIAAAAGVACAGQRSVMLAPADLDGDRDTDLVVFHEDAPLTVFRNELLGNYREEPITSQPRVAPFGGVVQDFNGDGRMDLLICPGPDFAGDLYVSGAGDLLEPHEQMGQILVASEVARRPPSSRVADVDLDGDLDVVLLGNGSRIHFADRNGRYAVRKDVWPAALLGDAAAIELAEMTGDGVPDLMLIHGGDRPRLELVTSRLDPPANWLAVVPSGVRNDNKQARCPESGYGLKLKAQVGRHQQTLVYTGLNGGLSQSRVPMIIGLDGADKVDYVFMTWTEGVTQSEIGLAAGQTHALVENERRESSCPVLFAWNGKRFEFISDFAGVGGLGYFVAPGEYAPPQVLEHVKIEPDQLVPRDGRYEVRVCEPMEEVAYVDRLELLAIDHPERKRVFPDERLVVTGAEATHRLLAIDEPIFPDRAVDHEGNDCLDNLRRVDRVYAYEPPRDRRFVGFCRPHSLVVDFGDRLNDLLDEPGVYLFVNGFIEYPYSQNTYAASQAGVTWQPMTIERQTTGGAWKTIIPDAGGPGGMGRTFTIDLTGKLSETVSPEHALNPSGEPLALSTRLRVSTNMDISYDQMFIAVDRGTKDVETRSVPLVSAELRRLGFPQEYSPDGRHPTIYNYDIIDMTSAFKMPSGRYTRYGPVEPLLAAFDDQYVILGSGDEIALSFDAGALPAIPSGHRRSFILVSHAYCKDMDLYTARGNTVEPLPFKDMSRYPYPAGEQYPTGDAFRDYQREFNTRRVN